MITDKKYPTSKEKLIQLRVSEELKEEFKEVAKLEKTDITKLIITHMEPILKDIKSKYQSEKNIE